jgi:sugar lactone lactonase YvrE
VTVFIRTVAGTATASAAVAAALVALTPASALPATSVRAAAAGTQATLVATAARRDEALDASPDPAGKVIYFTTNGSRGAAILRVPAGGGEPRMVLAGAPLRGPATLAVSGDGARLFVADRRAGHILVVPLRGGRPHVLRGTRGSAPRNLEIQTRGGRDHVVYSGRTRDGRPAVLRIAARGAALPSVVYAGSPLRSPDGIAIARGGAIYVSDHGTGGGRVLRLDSGAVTTLAHNVQLGHPGGIALTLDESKLLVSSLNRAGGTAQVLMLDTAGGPSSVFDDVIGENRSAGGLHRARAAVPLGWADVQRPGRIYSVDP